MEQLTSNERRAVELLRMMKGRRAHSTLRVEVDENGSEKLFEVVTRELPPDRPAPRPR